MRFNTKNAALAAGTAVLALLGMADAQSAEESAPPAEVAPAPRVDDPTLSPQERGVRAAEHLRRMDQVANNVRAQLETARTARDVVKVLCLNDKLNQLEVAIRSAQDRSTSLRGAIDRGDADRTRHEFTVIQVLRERVDALEAEANQCIGEESGFLGDTQVQVEIDPNIPYVEASDFGPDLDMLAQPPVVSSPID